MRMDYMVHDFAAMCRTLKPDARTVFLDMGASLDFHSGQESPAMYVTKLYSKFGFHFDHIYAFEVTPKDARQVYQKVPPEFMHSYHWMNIGVSAEVDSQYNPLSSIIKRFDKDDFIVVKLDIDTPHLEYPLVLQLLGDEYVTDLCLISCFLVSSCMLFLSCFTDLALP